MIFHKSCALATKSKCHLNRIEFSHQSIYSIEMNWLRVERNDEGAFTRAKHNQTNECTQNYWNFLFKSKRFPLGLSTQILSLEFRTSSHRPKHISQSQISNLILDCFDFSTADANNKNMFFVRKMSIAFGSRIAWSDLRNPTWQMNT